MLGRDKKRRKLYTAMMMEMKMKMKMNSFIAKSRMDVLETVSWSHHRAQR